MKANISNAGVNSAIRVRHLCRLRRPYQWVDSTRETRLSFRFDLGLEGRVREDRHALGSGV